MKSIFSKSSFPKASGGDRYEWKESATAFEISKNALCVIKISATAKSSTQNNSTDDDDLRIALDRFHLGKYERRTEKDKIAWKGFGTSSSWNGASLKGGTKTIYYFIELEKGQHNLQFFADGTPEILDLEIFTIENFHFELKNLAPIENIQSKGKGIPWLSFIFLGTNAKNLFFDVTTKSAKEKSTKASDKLKVLINGKPLENSESPTIKKYKNFYFYGDTKSSDQLSLSNKQLVDPLAFENSIELWYDQQPKIDQLMIDFFDAEGFIEEYKNLNFIKLIKERAWIAIKAFKLFLMPYSSKFLLHSLEPHPDPLIFKANHPIVSKVKADPAYKKIGTKLTEKLKAGQFEGEIWPKDFENDPDMKGQLNFDSWDLATALHGIKKIEYESKLSKSGQFSVKMKLFDIYDFQKGDLPSFLDFTAHLKQSYVNTFDLGEEISIINNFEIQININHKLWIP